MTFHVYRAADGWRWRLVAGNGRIVADSGEAYKQCAGAVLACGRLHDGMGGDCPPVLIAPKDWPTSPDA